MSGRYFFNKTLNSTPLLVDILYKISADVSSNFLYRYLLSLILSSGIITSITSLLVKSGIVFIKQ